jgi:hypothetical protein
MEAVSGPHDASSNGAGRGPDFQDSFGATEIAASAHVAVRRRVSSRQLSLIAARRMEAIDNVFADALDADLMKVWACSFEYSSPASRNIPTCWAAAYTTTLVCLV